MSPISFNFGSYSYRKTFFDSSYFQFSFGFLTDTVSSARSSSNLRCMVFENDNDVFTLSDKWLKFDLSSLNAAKLYPKVEIDDPASYLFTMKCYGAGVPSGSNTSNMSLTWRDSSYTLQTAT